MLDSDRPGDSGSGSAREGSASSARSGDWTAKQSVSQVEVFFLLFFGLPFVWMSLRFGVSLGHELNWLQPVEYAMRYVTVGALLWLVFRQHRSLKAFQERAVLGTAELLEAELTNTRINFVHVMRLRLRVKVPGQPPYPVAHRCTVPNVEQPRMVPGAELTVRVDPERPERLQVEWS